MWKVPAILNSLIDVKTLEEKMISCNEFMEDVNERIGSHNETLPTIAYFFKFKHISKT